MSYQSSHKQHQNKDSRLQAIVSLVVFPFVSSTIFSVEFPGYGELVPESNTYESWYYAVVTTRFVC